VVDCKKALEMSPSFLTEQHLQCASPWEQVPAAKDSSSSSGQLSATIQECCS